MVNAVSILSQCPAESSLTISVLLHDLGSSEDYVALLLDLRRFGLFRC